jgi:cellulose synthase/poly-beta-1,6-N-acetylglucosamine synthase-like glycosyltransferase
MRNIAYRGIETTAMALMEKLAAGRWAAAYFAVAMLWLGLLVGVAFIATPAKFMAPSLSLPVALDVGRYTFHIFNMVEWILTAVLIVISSGGGIAWPRLLAVAAGLMVIVEAIWILPFLDVRVSLIIAGKTPPPADLHGLHIGMEVTKLLVLVAIAFDRARQLVRMALRPLAEVERFVEVR